MYSARMMFVAFTLGLALPVARSTSTTTTNKACDLRSSDYLDHSPGTVATLAVCSELCEASSQCLAITFYADKHCSHFSKCPNLIVLQGATSVKYQARTSTLSLVAYGRECDFRHGGQVYLSNSP